MDDRKFYVPGMIVGAITLLMGFFMIPVEGMVMGGVGLFLNLKNRKQYRTKIGMIFTVLGILEAVSFLGVMIYMGFTKQGAFDYWLFRFLF